MVEHDQLIVLRSSLSAEGLAPFASADAALDVVRVVDEDKRYALFVVGGELNEDTTPQLLEFLVAAARIPAVDLVIVDLLRVAWLGGPGVGALEAATRAARRHDAEFVVCRPSGFVRRVLEAAGLSGLIAPDTDDADDGSWRWSEDL